MILIVGSVASLVWWFVSRKPLVLLIGVGLFLFKVVKESLEDKEWDPEFTLGIIAFILGAIVGLFIKPFYVYGMIAVILFGIFIAVHHIKELQKPESQPGELHIWY